MAKRTFDALERWMTPARCLPPIPDPLMMLPTSDQRRLRSWRQRCRRPDPAEDGLRVSSAQRTVDGHTGEPSELMRSFFEGSRALCAHLPLPMFASMKSLTFSQSGDAGTSNFNRQTLQFLLVNGQTRRTPTIRDLDDGLKFLALAFEHAADRHPVRRRAMPEPR